MTKFSFYTFYYNFLLLSESNIIDIIHCNVRRLISDILLGSHACILKIPLEYEMDSNI